ncbi:hypothetical protein BU23DRAFT_625403 [Bimuria novae-zelandiae CBS 107.79]|uniref:NACHT domain-containing protein n=1 Tax=Bimuria novae-zelandiae CBS 107.79 TaxID=1447943 RepID=A0A6A5VSL8_9PLEO|nr:hypothetical protein BU23DRAFT_625403 [Bimuria novae-zelandiae CBS 107.79]
MAASKASEDAADNDCVNAFKIDTNHVFQKDRNAKCAPATGQWFFHHPEYEAFQEANGLQLLFVTAEAGGGKSTLMRTFIDSLQESDDRPLVAYFFFKDDDDQLRSYEDALSSIIYQLLIQERGFIKHAKESYKRYGHGIRYQSKEMWNILLTSAAEAHRRVVCVLDAVDECAPAGRRELVSDLVAASQRGPKTTSTKLKFVVTSRPYQDKDHPYADLASSDVIRHLAGEIAKVQTDIQTVIRFKAEELAKKHELSKCTLDMLIENISSQNLQTRSFLAVRMAFELLDSHQLMQKGAEEHIVRKILTDIPQFLGDQFDAMLNRSPDREHARRLFCVILAARKTLKIPELKVLYALTRPTNSEAEDPHSYEELNIPTDDEEFKQLIRARFGLFITFVRSSVHLFHQTAREYLMAKPGMIIGTSYGTCPMPSEPESYSLWDRARQQSWKGIITEADANVVMLTVCLDLFKFETPRSWILGA